MFFFCWGYVTTLTYYSQRITQKTRVEYLRAILRQDTKWFDTINVQELSSKMSRDIGAIERAIGDKAGFVMFGISRSVAGFGFAFGKGWLLSLILAIGFPIIGLFSFFLFKSLQSGYDIYMRAYSQSAGYAEQAVNAIKVVHSYGQERVEVQNYTKYLTRAKKAGMKQQLT